jgi:outer membrane lipoprotein-sorting protein
MKTIKFASFSIFPWGMRFMTIPLFLLTLGSSALPSQSKEDPELRRIFNQLDENAKNFRGFAAKYLQKQYRVILKEFDSPPETGEFLYSPNRDGSARLRKEAKSPGKSIATIKNGVAQVYQPNTKDAQQYNIGGNKDLTEYLTVGIGQSSAKLQEIANVSYQGSESIDGTPCAVVILKFKDPKKASYFSSIAIWYSKANGIPVQYKMQEPNSDYYLITFSGQKWNANIPDSKFDQKFPAGTKVQKY